MEEYIDPERIANSITMDSNYKGYYIIVEGEKDYKIYSKFIDESQFDIAIAFGCENALKVSEILLDRNNNKHIVIIDSDFRKILKQEVALENVFMTDSHDIEIDIILTKAFDDVLRHYCSKQKISNFQNKATKPIRELLFNTCLDIGYLKLLNKTENLGLVFKPKKKKHNTLTYKTFINTKDTIELVSVDKMIEVVYQYSLDKSSSLKNKNEIKERYDNFIEQREKYDYPLEQMINGHDITSLMFLLIKGIGSKKTLQRNDEIEDVLYLAYDSRDFKLTNLYSNLHVWSINAGVKIFNDRCSSSS